MIGCDRQDRVVFLTINEPPVNVLTTALCSELSMQLNSLVGDDGIAAVLLLAEPDFGAATASGREGGRQAFGQEKPVGGFTIWNRATRTGAWWEQRT